MVNRFLGFLGFRIQGLGFHGSLVLGLGIQFQAQGFIYVFYGVGIWGFQDLEHRYLFCFKGLEYMISFIEFRAQSLLYIQGFQIFMVLRIKCFINFLGFRVQVLGFLCMFQDLWFRSQVFYAFFRFSVNIFQEFWVLTLWFCVGFKWLLQGLFQGLQD